MAEERKKLTTSKINSMLKAAGYDWKAGQTSISQLDEKGQDLRLGLEVRDEEMERIEFALSKEVKTFKFTPKRDWREKDGENWVTNVRDQGSCGSCVAFASIATIETQARIQYEAPSWNLNLSEGDLFFCGAGRKCQQGWWPTYALDYTKDKGISDEKCFPYQDKDMNCTLCSDKENRFIKIGQWQEIINIDERKNWLDSKGPLIACMAVYRDFFSYVDGIYKHVTGDLAGYHAVSCIGYSEDEGYWICKNSWGTNWGSHGFFKIAYGQADMDTRFAMYGVDDINGTLIPEGKEEGCDWAEHIAIDNSFTNNRMVFWAYVNGKWRYQLVSEAHLARGSNMLFGANSIQACYKGKNLTRITGWKKLS